MALNAGEEADGNPTAGKKPIHYAVESGSEEAVALLCDRGANLEVGNTENLGECPGACPVCQGLYKYLLSTYIDLAVCLVLKTENVKKLLYVLV